MTSSIATTARPVSPPVSGRRPGGTVGGGVGTGAVPILTEGGGSVLSTVGGTSVVVV